MGAPGMGGGSFLGTAAATVAGVVGGSETSRVRDDAFAGAISCYAADDFETGLAAFWVREESAPGNRWGVTALAESGALGFADSPAGLAQGQILRMITDAGKTAVERDALYNVVQVWS